MELRFQDLTLYCSMTGKGWTALSYVPERDEFEVPGWTPEGTVVVTVTVEDIKRALGDTFTDSKMREIRSWFARSPKLNPDQGIP